MDNSNLPVMKYIVTDDFKPLHALKKVFGPPSGPLKKPVRIKVELVGDLLKQYDAPKLFEVIPVGNKANGEVIYSKRVELTIANYRESWYTISGEEIPVVGLGAATPSTETPISNEKSPVEEVPVETAIDGDAPMEEVSVEDVPVEDTPMEEVPVEEVPVEEVSIETLDAVSVVEVVDLPEEVVVESTSPAELPTVDQEALAKILSNPNPPSSGKKGKKK